MQLSFFDSMNAVVASPFASSSGLNLEMNLGWRRMENLTSQHRSFKTSRMTHLDSPCFSVQIGFYVRV